MTVRALFLNGRQFKWIRPGDTRPDEIVLASLKNKQGFNVKGDLQIAHIPAEHYYNAVTFGPDILRLDKNGNLVLNSDLKRKIEESIRLRSKAVERSGDESKDKSKLFQQLHDEAYNKDIKWVIEFLRALMPEDK